MLIKICGVTSVLDAELAIDLGADYIGLIFHPPSPRNISLGEAKEITDQVLSKQKVPVGVFVHQTIDEILSICKQTGIRTVQLHGAAARSHYPQLEAFQIFYMREGTERGTINEREKFHSLKSGDFYLFDSSLHPHAGRFNWKMFDPKGYSNWFLAGGLNPNNIEVAINLLHPSGVDVCSGIEKTPGVKDPAKLKAFIGKVKKCL